MTQAWLCNDRMAIAFSRLLTINLQCGASSQYSSIHGQNVYLVQSGVTERRIPEFQRSSGRQQAHSALVCWLSDIASCIKVRYINVFIEPPVYGLNWYFCWTQCRGEHYGSTHRHIQGSFWQQSGAFAQTCQETSINCIRCIGQSNHSRRLRQAEPHARTHETHTHKHKFSSLIATKS